MTTSEEGSAWDEAFTAARRRWPGAVVRVTRLKEGGASAYLAAALTLTTVGTGAEDVAVAFGETDAEALRALAAEVAAFHRRAAGGAG